MTIQEEALACPQCGISVMGDHAGENAESIFSRKKADIERTGKTFWLMRSPKARPKNVQVICSSIPTYTVFIEPATKGGARPTTREDAAKEYSKDGILWHRLPNGLSSVTGKLDAGATALVKAIIATPKKEKKTADERFQVAIKYAKKISVTAFSLSETSFLERILGDLESKWKQDPRGTRFDKLREEHLIVQKTEKHSELAPAADATRG